MTLARNAVNNGHTPGVFTVKNYVFVIYDKWIDFAVNYGLFNT
jgi:hypothetical protein